MISVNFIVVLVYFFYQQLLKFCICILCVYFFSWVRYVSEQNPVVANILSKGLKAYTRQNWWVSVPWIVFTLRCWELVQGIKCDCLFIRISHWTSVKYAKLVPYYFQPRPIICSPAHFTTTGKQKWGEGQLMAHVLTQ